MSNPQYLKTQWTTLISKFKNPDLTTTLWKEIHNAYTQSSRHYHSLDHIEAMLRLAEEFKPEIIDFETLQFTIFYHDMIYQSLRKDNELKSAELAQQRLQELGYPAEKIQKCYDQIIATQLHEPTEDTDLQYLLDFDLSILGSDEAIYDTYAQNVRKEYAWVPGFMYRKGRKKVLKHFLDMPFIYKTEVFRDRLEDRAKANMKRELNSL